MYRGDDQTDVESQFRNHTVEITHEELPPEGPDPFLVIEEDDTFAGALPVESLNWLLEPPVSPPGDKDGISAGYRVLFDVLGETVFTSMDRRQLLAVSREIEDRALRVGAGTLRVSFQTLSAFRPQVEVYRHLATETNLDIHIYGLDDWTPPTIAGVTYHSDSGSAVDRYWLLAFDGGDDPTQACALLAQEQADGYAGVWTDDSEIVGRILSALDAL